MLGILLISIENGRGVITYGVNLPKIYNMRHALFTAVIFISYSVCVFSDLEIYPGINLEDQENNYEPSDRNFAPLYAERRWHEKDSWPRLQQEYFGDGQNQPKFNARLAASYKRIRDLIDKQTKELKDKMHSSVNNFLIPDPLESNNEDFRKFLSSQIDHSKYLSQHILEDVRPYPQDNSDFSFHGENDDIEDGSSLNDEEMEVEKLPDTIYYTDENTDSDKDRNEIIYEVKVDDPTQFAYPPSDPRFYEDSTYPENKIQRDIIDANSNVLTNQQQYSAQVDPDVNRISYTGAYQEIMDDPRERTDNSVKVVAVRPNSSDDDTAGVYIIAVVAGISAAATVGLIAFGIGWYNLQKHVKNASDVEYPAYGITGPNKEISPSGDRRLAQSAQMYHYQHQKQQIIAMERAADTERHGSVSEADSDEENEEGDYTVYEYAGLAPIGEMEVKNPLFQDDPTPAQTPALKSNGEDIQKK